MPPPRSAVRAKTWLTLNMCVCRQQSATLGAYVSGLGSGLGSALDTGVGTGLGSGVGSGVDSDAGSDDVDSGLDSALGTPLGSGVGNGDGSGLGSDVGKKGGPPTLDEPLRLPESTAACKPGVFERMPECEGTADTLAAGGSVIDGEATVMEASCEVAERSEAGVSPANRTSAVLGTSSPEKTSQPSPTERLRLILRVPESKATAMLPTMLSPRPDALSLQALPQLDGLKQSVALVEIEGNSADIEGSIADGGDSTTSAVVVVNVPAPTPGNVSFMAQTYASLGLPESPLPPASAPAAQASKSKVRTRSLPKLNERNSYVVRCRCRRSASLGAVLGICYRRSSSPSSASFVVACRVSMLTPLTPSFVVVLRPVLSSLKLKELVTLIQHAPAVVVRSIAVAVIVVVFESWSSDDAGGNGREKREALRRRLAVGRGPPRGHDCCERWHDVGGTAGGSAGTTQRLENTSSSAAPKYAPKTASSSVPHVPESDLFEVGGRARSLIASVRLFSQLSRTVVMYTSRYSTNARPR